jgi:hypothetical protein
MNPSRLERVELLPLLCGLADRLRHCEHVIDMTLFVDRACSVCLSDAQGLEASLADLVEGVCDSLPGCMRAVSIDVRAGPHPNRPPRVQVIIEHKTSMPTFDTLASLRAFAAKHEGGIESRYLTPAGLMVSFCLPAPADADTPQHDPPRHWAQGGMPMMST